MGREIVKGDKKEFLEKQEKNEEVDVGEWRREGFKEVAVKCVQYKLEVKGDSD